MASSTLATPPFPALHQDLRSASQPYKRDKDHTWKWIDGRRPLGGLREMNVSLDSAGYKPKWSEDKPPSGQVGVRPRKQRCQYIHTYKSHANRASRLTTATYLAGRKVTSNQRIRRKIEVQVEANSYPEISRSMLELMPRHLPDNSTSIRFALDTHGHDEMNYPIEYSGLSSSNEGRPIGLGSLVEEAEKKFRDKQTELLVKQDYEVLDADGESVVLNSEKKHKGSPKQKAEFETETFEENDGFELI